MDCPSEENMIRMKLDGIEVIRKLEFDIENRNLTFKGYKRANGDVGVRNEIWLIPTVGCVNGTINSLAQKLRTERTPFFRYFST